MHLFLRTISKLSQVSAERGRSVTLLHFGDELLVEETARLLVKWAVDGDNITLRQHILKILHASAAYLTLDVFAKRLVVKIQQFFAIKGFQPPEDPLADPAHRHSTHDFVFKIILILRNASNVPFTCRYHLMSRDKVADEIEDGHDDVLCHGDDVGAGDLGDGDAAIGRVGGVEVDVVGADAGGDGEFEVFGFGEALRCEIAWVEAVKWPSVEAYRQE